MQVKIFEAPDMATGLRQVRKELGPDALILSTRTIKDGKLGLLGKKYLEITAAVDHQYEEKTDTKHTDEKIAKAASHYAENSTTHQRENNVTTSIQTHKKDSECLLENKDLTFRLEPKNQDSMQQ